MIDLAPGHKLGFVVSSPVLLAAGIVGLGEAVPSGVEPSKVGAVVVGPLQRHPSAGSEVPRLAEAPGQFVLETGLQNRGLNATLKRYARYWARLEAPVVVQLADMDVGFLGHVAARLAENQDVSGFELLVPRDIRNRDNQRHNDGTSSGAVGEWLVRAVQAIDQNSDLPIWVKLPLDQSVILAPIAVDAGAVGLVVGQLPVGVLLRKDTPGNPVSGSADGGAEAFVRGALYGPSTFPLMLTVLADLIQQNLPAAIIACGGIHSVAQAQQALAIGAGAVQLDSAVWIEPGIVALICDSMQVD